MNAQDWAFDKRRKTRFLDVMNVALTVTALVFFIAHRDQRERQKLDTGPGAQV